MWQFVSAITRLIVFPPYKIVNLIKIVFLVRKLKPNLPNDVRVVRVGDVHLHGHTAEHKLVLLRVQHVVLQDSYRLPLVTC